MNYKLIEGSLNDLCNVKGTILLNRGITDARTYLNLTEKNTHDFMLLDNIEKAVECLNKHIENNNNIHIIVDSDVDGFTSASIMYRYLKKIKPDCKLTYSLHTRKQHGISEDIEIPYDCNLLIIPDAGSNDVEQCMRLHENGVDIIILDHHICDIKNDFAIVVNNQMCDYPNKNLSGVGIVYKFLQALDAELWENYADDFLDIVALGNISDVMDMREFETRYYVDLGLNKISSKLFKALIEKQSYSMNNEVNITSVQFYVTPILNAMIRVGNFDDKDLLFRAFIETDEVFKYKKRGQDEEVDEDIYTRAARLCSNAKSRQGKEVEKGVEKIEEIIRERQIDKDKIMFINITDVLSDTLTGLVAIKIAEKYNKPCLLLRKQKDSIEDNILYGGSCRNFDNSPIESLKNFLCSLGTFEFVQGHDNAAGISIPQDNIVKTIKKCNKLLINESFEKCFNVDFDMNIEELDVTFIKTVDDMKHIFGQGLKEPLVHIKNIPVSRNEVMVMGKNKDTWKIISIDGYAFVKFKVAKDDAILNEYNNGSDDYIGEIDVIGTVSVNNFNGILTPQINIKEYVFRKEEW